MFEILLNIALRNKLILLALVEIFRMCVLVSWQLSQQVVPGRQQTITIHDTPSPAVSVITISDSEDETPGKW